MKINNYCVPKLACLLFLVFISTAEAVVDMHIIRGDGALQHLSYDGDDLTGVYTVGVGVTESSSGIDIAASDTGLIHVTRENGKLQCWEFVNGNYTKRDEVTVTSPPEVINDIAVDIDGGVHLARGQTLEYWGWVSGHYVQGGNVYVYSGATSIGLDPWGGIHIVRGDGTLQYWDYVNGVYIQGDGPYVTPPPINDIGIDSNGGIHLGRTDTLEYWEHINNIYVRGDFAGYLPGGVIRLAFDSLNGVHILRGDHKLQYWFYSNGNYVGGEMTFVENMSLDDIAIDIHDGIHIARADGVEYWRRDGNYSRGNHSGYLPGGVKGMAIIENASGPTVALTVLIDSPETLPQGAVSPVGTVVEIPQNTTYPIRASKAVKCPAVWEFSHWEGTGIANPLDSNTTVLMDEDKTITAVYIDGRECGDECRPFMQLDFNHDCVVNLIDFAMFAINWLDCNQPACE